MANKKYDAITDTGPVVSGDKALVLRGDNSRIVDLGSASSQDTGYFLTDTGQFLTDTGQFLSSSNASLTDPVITGCILEDVFTITDGAGFEIDPGNGSIQFVTLGASRTPQATNFQNGESVTLRIADGSAFTITWSTVGVVWKDAAAPTLATSGYTEVHLEKADNVIRGVHVGDFAS